MNARKVTRFSIRVSVGLIAIVSWPTSAGELPKYQVVDLGTLGGVSSVAADINSSGHVVGRSTTTVGSAGAHAFLYFDGVMTDIGTLGGSYSLASGVNSAGAVVGYGNVAGTSGYEQSFLYREGTTVSVGSLGGLYTYAEDINDRGEVVGHGTTAAGLNRAFLHVDGAMTELGTLGGFYSNAFAINQQGRIVGQSTMVLGNTLRAFLYVDGTMTNLGTLGGDTSRAYDISDAGHIVGSSTIAGDGATHAFLYEDGAMRDLGTLGGTNSYANGINAPGVVVGRADLPCAQLPCAAAAFIWDDVQGMTRLDSLVNGDLGWWIIEAAAINDAGQIAGSGNQGGTFNHAVLLNPIPLLFLNLAEDSTGVGPGKKLVRQVGLAEAYYDADDLQATCAELLDYNAQVDKFARKKIQPETAEDLRDQSGAIMEAIGCNSI